MKIHTGDTVVIITGKDKGKTGRVLRVLQNQNRVVITGANMRTRHIKKTPQSPGKVLRYEASLHASNVMLLDPKTKKRTRVGRRTVDGVKARYAKRSGEKILSGRKLKAFAEEDREETKDTKETEETKGRFARKKSDSSKKK